MKLTVRPRRLAGAALLLVARFTFAYALEPWPQDKDFLTKASRLAMLQLKLAEVAAKRSARSDTRMLAAQLAADYQRIQTGLAGLARTKSVQVAGQLDEKDAALVKGLEDTAAETVEAAIIDGIGPLQRQDIRTYEGESAAGVDPDIRKFASTQLGVLKGHITMLDTIRDRVHSGK